MRAMVAQLKSDSEDLQQVNSPGGGASAVHHVSWSRVFIPLLCAGDSERVEELVVARRRQQQEDAA